MTDKEIFRKASQEEYEEMEAQLAKLIEENRASIPTNEEIINLIPSKAVREYLVKIGHEFSEKDRFILKCYLVPKDDDELNSVWEKGRYVSLPHPFRRGDIVAAFGESEHHEGSDYDLGIMRSFDDEKSWKDWDNDIRARLPHLTDFSDVATTVEFLEDDGSFSHNHPNPMELEFAKDIPGTLTEDSERTKLLVAASDLLKGTGSIEYYEMRKESYAKSPEHLIELLEKTYSTLHRYAKGFESFRSLYIPNNFAPIQKLNKSDKLKSGQILMDMEIEACRISGYVKNLLLPAKTLSNKKVRGCFYKEIDEEGREELSRLVTEIQEEHKLIQERIAGFLKHPDCPRKQFYQKRLAKEMRQLSSMLAKQFPEK